MVDERSSPSARASVPGGQHPFHPRLRLHPRLPLAPLLLLLTACGAASSSPVPPASELAVHAGAPRTASPVSSSVLPAGAPVEALGLSGGGALVVAADGRVLVRGGAGLEARALYREGDDPPALGAVHAIAPSRAGGAWVAAESGLFELGSLYVTHERLELGRVRAACEVPAGPLAGLWLAARGGLVRRGEDSLDLYTLAEAAAEPARFAFDEGGRAALVADGGALALVVPDGDHLVSDCPPLGAGRVYGLAGGDGVLWAAAEHGVVRWDPAHTPAWTRFPLTPDETTGEAALAIAVEPATGVAWARTASGLVLVDGEALTRYATATVAADAPALLAVGRRGEVYTAVGSVVTALETETATAVTFTRDVRPWLTERCAACHSNQTQDFRDYPVFAHVAELALAKVRAGDMPRCAGGLPCPEGQRLDPTDYAVLEAWLRAGSPE